MKHRDVKAYAKALAELAAQTKGAQKQDKVAGKFFALLRQNGLMAKAPAIIALAGELAREAAGSKRVLVETARPMDSQQKKLVGAVAGKGDAVIEKITPELVAGIRITVDGKRQFDFSMKKKLETLFDIPA